MRSNLPYVRHDVCTKRSTCPNSPDYSYDHSAAAELTAAPAAPCSTSFQTALWLLVGLLSIPNSTSSSRSLGVSQPWSLDECVGRSRRRVRTNPTREV